MKLLLVASALALTSAGCIVPSLSELDSRLAAVGIPAAPHRWSVEASIRVADERRGSGKKKGGRSIVWASADSASGVVRQPVIGEVTRASAAVRIGLEGSSFTVSRIPSEHRAAVASALAVIGGTVSGGEEGSSSGALSTATFSLHGLDCAQRTRMGWLDLMCDLEAGPSGESLLSLAKGRVERGALRGAVITHDAKKDSNSKNKKAANGGDEGIRYALLCDSDAEDDEDTGKTPARAFGLSLAFPAATPEGDEDDDSNNGGAERSVEVYLRFTKAKGGALAAAAGEGGDAPTTVVGADGVAVYLLRGSTVLGRWLMPLVYGLALVFLLPYAATYASKAMAPKPTVNLEKDGALAAKTK